MDNKTTINVFHDLLSLRELYHNMIINPPKTYEEAMRQANDYTNASETNLAKR